MLGSPEIRGGAGLNGWTTGLVVCPVLNLLDVLKVEVIGWLELVDSGLGLPASTSCGGLGLPGSSGFCPGRRLGSDRGLG